MQTDIIEFQQNARRVYTAIKHIVYHKGRFTHIEHNNDRFSISARRGGVLSPLSENIQIKVVAQSSDSSRVTIKSSSRSFLNLLNLGANKRNIEDLADFIRNEVGKLASDEEIKLRR